MINNGLVRKQYNGIVNRSQQLVQGVEQSDKKNMKLFYAYWSLKRSCIHKSPMWKTRENSDITDSTRWLDKYTCIECEDLRREEEQIVLDPTLTLANWLPIPLSLCLCHCKWQPASGCSINQWAGSVGKWISRRHMPLITDPQFSLTKVQSHYSTAVHV